MVEGFKIYFYHNHIYSLINHVTQVGGVAGGWDIIDNIYISYEQVFQLESQVFLSHIFLLKGSFTENKILGYKLHLPAYSLQLTS